ncbi:hypothetical protein M5689_017926 [Euphorbia peplus]|nr:hypothetical protein M5689_017926 [Euphorbia peplus]
MVSSRTSAFSQDEDVLLCSILVELTQDPTAKTNQTRECNWRQVGDAYNGRKDLSWGLRSWRSLDSRYQKIEFAVKKLKECLRMVELKTPSGISDRDILDMAKQLMRTDPKWKSGFKFDHVWYLVKGLDKAFNGKTNVENEKPVIGSSESENSTSKSPIQQSPGLSDFFIPLNENHSALESAEREMEVKKARTEKKKEAQSEYGAAKVKQENVKLLELLAESNEMKTKIQMNRETQREEAMTKMKQENANLFTLLVESNEIQKKHLKLEEDKVMLRDVNSIEDPLVREYFRRRQQQIVKSIIAEDSAQ